MDDGLREAHALAITFRKLPDDLVSNVRDGAALAGVVDPCAQVRPGQPLELADECQILGNPHFRINRRSLGQISDALFHFERLFENVESGHRGRAAGGRQEARQHAHRRGFAGAVRSQKSDDLPSLDFKRDLVHSRCVCVPFR